MARRNEAEEQKKKAWHDYEEAKKGFAELAEPIKERQDDKKKNKDELKLYK